MRGNLTDGTSKICINQNNFWQSYQDWAELMDLLDQGWRASGPKANVWNVSSWTVIMPLPCPDGRWRNTCVVMCVKINLWQSCSLNVAYSRISFVALPTLASCHPHQRHAVPERVFTRENGSHSCSRCSSFGQWLYDSWLQVLQRIMVWPCNVKRMFLSCLLVPRQQYKR